MKMKTFAVIGIGRFGQAVAERLYEMGHEVLAVDTDDERIQEISDKVTHAVVADAKDADTLASLGVRNYDCAVVSIGENIADSTLVTLSLKEAGVANIICKAKNEQHKKILLKIGADKVIIPEEEMGKKVASQLASTNLMGFLELSDNYSISEIKAPAKWVGKSVAALDVRNKCHVNIAAVKEAGRDMNVTIGADYSFKSDDIIVVIGRRQDVEALQ